MRDLHRFYHFIAEFLEEERNENGMKAEWCMQWCAACMQMIHENVLQAIYMVGSMEAWE